MMNSYDAWLKHKEYKYTPEFLLFGVILLHSKIRILVHLINLSSKKFLPKNKHQARGEHADGVKARKEVIKKRFIDAFHLRVEEPRASGGTSTTGNVARKAFSDPHKLSTILELNHDMVANIALLLSALSSHLPINVVEYEKLAKETDEIYVKEYANIWQNNSLHRILHHGAAIISESVLPTGYMSEEGSEAKNKTLRFNREHHARKNSRVNNLTDVFYRSLEESDEVIKSFGVTQRLKFAKKSQMPPELKRLLIMPHDDEDGNDFIQNELDLVMEDQMEDTAADPDEFIDGTVEEIFDLED